VVRSTLEDNEVDERGFGGRVGPRHLFEEFPYGLALVGRGGEIVELNHRARRVLLAGSLQPPGWTCCDLICSRTQTILGTQCMSDLALEAGRELPEVRIDLDGERLRTSAWVTASAVGSDPEFVLFHLRPGRPGDRRRRTRQGWHGDSPGGVRAELRINTLGAFAVESGADPIAGDWLAQRPGQILKLLVCERRRTMASDRIAEALWPGVGHEDGRNRVRFHIHGLRERLDPSRTPHKGSRFILSQQGGYQFDTSVAWVDADEFEREAQAGLRAVGQGDGRGALPHLIRASALYRGDFLAEEPYAEWAIEERERLRDLAAQVLRKTIDLELEAGGLEAASLPARRLAQLEPFDSEAQRLLITITLRRGRRGEAIRRYDHFRVRMQQSLGAEPDFALRDLDVV
jgi:DNA-binding SARP family transcriptional activator